MSGGDLMAETLTLRARYDEEPSHSDQVAALALQLFDALPSWHGLGPRERELLGCAALLHDIGWSQTTDGKGHHKRSARLIGEQRWRNLTPAEVKLVAQIARYHRKAVPQPEHVEFHSLEPEEQKKVMVLGGMLRIADALDRTHTSRIEWLEGSATEEAILIRVKPRGPWDAERVMVETKRDMLELAAKRPVACEAVP